jgi:hypothetical protein
LFLAGRPAATRESAVESLLTFADSFLLDTVKVTLGIRIYPYTTLAKIAVHESINEVIYSLVAHVSPSGISDDISGYFVKYITAHIFVD